MSDRSAVVELTNASVERDHSVVLSNVDFRLQASEFVVLLGANASGKTTLVKAALGLIPLIAGEARLFGKGVDRFREWTRVGYVPQRVTAASGVPATVDEVVMSGRANRLGIVGRFSRTDRAASTRAMELVDLLDVRDAPVGHLSGGQQQRVLIARALASEPEVLVLDEPVASVDLAHQESFARTLEVLLDQGTSILMVAHTLGSVQRLVERAVVLDHGRVTHDGPPVGLELAHAHHPEADHP